MSNDSLPDCKEFISAAVVKLRRPPTAKSTAFCGLSLKKLAAVMTASPYTSDIYSQSMRDMLDAGSLLITTGILKYNFSERSGYQRRIIDLESIPATFRFDDNEFYSDAEGDLYEPFAECDGWESRHKKKEELREADVQYVCFKRLTVYIASDELPKSVAKLMGRSTFKQKNGSRADQQLVKEILEKLK